MGTTTPDDAERLRRRPEEGVRDETVALGLVTADGDAAQWRRAHARLLRLYEIGKVLTRTESVERAMSEILALVCGTTPLRTAILLLDDASPRRTRALLWREADVTAAGVTTARRHALTAYAYLAGIRPGAPAEEEDRGLLPSVARSSSVAPVPDKRHGFVLLPLVVDHQRIFGALQVEAAARLDEAGLMFIDAVVNHLAIAFDRLAAVRARHAEAEARQAAAEALALHALRAEQEQRFLAKTSALLATALDESSTHTVAVRAAVPLLADLCVLDAVVDGRVLRREVVFADSGKEHLAERIKALTPTAEVLESGRSVLVPVLTDAEIGAYDREHAAMLKEIGAQSLMIVPLVAHGRTIGALTLVSTSERRYGSSELELAEDVARRAALATDSVRRYEEARRAVQMREDLLEIVSHDLRNPLGNILLSAVALRRTIPRDDAAGLKSLDMIQRSADRMQRIIVDLLDLASMDSGRLAIEKTHESVRELVEDAIESLVMHASRKAVTLDSTLVDESLEVECDRGRILQVFGNLIGNAIKFSRDGGTIEVRAERRGPDVLFSVADTGPGISPSELAHVFDRYWQTRETAHLGTGLGLSIAKGLVLAHSGRIWADSVLGWGATFFFTLPARGS